jgi:hypothetical protein
MTEERAPALYGHCVTAYNAMRAHAQPHEAELLYQGALTHLFKEIGFTSPYYSFITRRLTAMGCVRQIRRGGGPYVESQWLLITEPTIELFHETAESDGVNVRGMHNSSERMEWQYRNLSQRVLRIEQALGFVSKDEDDA